MEKTNPQQPEAPGQQDEAVSSNFPPNLCPYSDVDLNPHVKEFADKVIIEDFNPRQAALPFRVLQPDYQGAPYRRRNNEQHSVSVNRSKRDLLMWIEFLTICKKQVVVFSKTPARKLLQVVTDMFKQVKFFFFGALEDAERDNAVFRKEKLADKEACYEFGDFALIYLNDANVDPKKSVEEQNQVHIDNLQRQKDTVQKLRPGVFLLPFQLPWNEDKIEFFAGQLYIPPHGFHSQTELALCATDCDQMTEYDAKKIEQQMFYFNTVTRGTLYNHRLTVGQDGKFFRRLDCCFDCTSELYILIQYFKAVRHVDAIYEVFDLNNVYAKIEEACQLRYFSEKKPDAKKGK